MSSPPMRYVTSKPYETKNHDEHEDGGLEWGCGLTLLLDLAVEMS